MIVPRQHVMVLVDAKLETLYDHGGRRGIFLRVPDHKRNNKLAVIAGEVKFQNKVRFFWHILFL